MSLTNGTRKSSAHLIRKYLLQALAFLSVTIGMGVCFYNIISYPLKKAHVPVQFGATYMTMDNLYFDVLNTAIQEVLETNGDTLITRDPAQSQAKQSLQIEDMLALGVKLIFVNPVDAASITPALELCKKRNVPVIIVDTAVERSELAVSVIQSDNYDAGVQIAKDIMQKRTDAHIAALYDKAIESTARRLQGCLDTLNAADYKYRIVYMASGTTLLQPSMIAMQKFLDMGLYFDVVFGGNDPTALGALAAIQKNHLPQNILIYGIDGSPSCKTMVQQGLVEGTSAQFPQVMGKTAAKVAYEYLAGKAVQHDITIPVRLITRQNLDSYNMLGWQ